MKKKDINAEATVKHIVIKFVSYTIIIGFICFIILVISNYLLKDFSGTSSRGLYITLPLIAIILLYSIIHGICRLSTHDTFRKFKTNPDNYSKITKYLDTFFIICIIFSIFIFLDLLYLNLTLQTKIIENSIAQQKLVFSEEHVNNLATEMLNSYNFSKTNLTISTVILVTGISISLLSLIPYQKKMILKYNTYEKDNTVS